jgi:hypothetical protein
MAKKPNEPELPRVEPEIIPPDASGHGSWPPNYGYGTHRVYVGRIGPFGFALLMMLIGLFGGVLLLIMIGTALIWIPIVALFVFVAAISRLFRRY